MGQGDEMIERFNKWELDWLGAHGARRVTDVENDCYIYRVSFPSCRLEIKKDVDGLYRAWVTDGLGTPVGITCCQDRLEGCVSGCVQTLETRSKVLSSMCQEISQGFRN